MTENMIKLVEERNRMIGQMQEMQQKEEREGIGMTAEEQANFDKVCADIDAMGKRIANAKAIEERQACLEKPINELRAKEQPSGRIETSGAEKHDNFLRYLRSGIAYDRRAMETGTDSEGGYLCPDEYIRKLIDTTKHDNVMRNLATIIRTSSGTAEVPIVSGNVTAYWTAEEAAYTAADMAFTHGTLSAYKATALTLVSEELVHDSAFDIENLVMMDQARQVGALEEAAFIAGNGTGKPTGVVGSAHTTVTTASASAITADELIDLVYALPGKFRKNACFIMNDATVAKVRKLKTGEGQYIWQPAFVGGQPDTLLGYKLYTSSNMPTIAGGAKPVIFGDMSYYWIADREGAVMQRLVELYAANGQIGFRLRKRVDGKLMVSTAVEALTMHT